MCSTTYLTFYKLFAASMDFWNMLRKWATNINLFLCVVWTKLSSLVDQLVCWVRGGVGWQGTREREERSGEKGRKGSEGFVRLSKLCFTKLPPCPNICRLYSPTRNLTMQTMQYAWWISWTYLFSTHSLMVSPKWAAEIWVYKICPRCDLSQFQNFPNIYKKR